MANLDQVAHREYKLKELISMHRIGRFLVSRWLQLCEISAESQHVIDEWFNKSEITINIIADTIEKVQIIQRMLFTWKNCFAKNLREIRATNLI